MKKKILIFTLILAVSITAYFLIQSSKEEDVDLSNSESQILTDDKSISEPLVSLDGTTDPPEEIEEEFLTAQFEQYIDKVEDDWSKNMEELFLHKNSDDRDLKEYLKLKKGYEQERERRYEAFHKMMEEKHGPNYSYSPSDDEEMFNEKLVKIYQKNLSKIIGDEKMIEYLKVKDQFNQKLEKESEGSDSYILIEF